MVPSWLLLQLVAWQLSGNSLPRNHRYEFSTEDSALHANLATFLHGEACRGERACPIQVEGTDALGAAVAWLMVNRPHDSVCSIAGPTGNAICFHPPSVPVRLSNAPLKHGGIEPATCVEVYHIHCHFDATPESEMAALSLL